jgi:multicomponent Na+:H+ antiporter subunit E
VNALLWNVGLALLWAAVTGNFTGGNLVVGFLVGFGVLFFTRRVVGGPQYVGKIQKGVALAIFFLWELVKSNFRVAHDVLTLRHHMRPAIIAVPLEVETDAEITMLANLITLTPGSTTIDISDDRRTLYVHVMYVDGPDVESERADYKEGFERRVLELFR